MKSDLCAWHDWFWVFNQSTHVGCKQLQADISASGFCLLTFVLFHASFQESVSNADFLFGVMEC